jgi:hypothetical protein
MKLLAKLKAMRCADERSVSILIEAVESGCPPATQSIDLNLKNRQKAIDEYHYGPLNPNEPNEEYWAELADKWNTDDIESVKNNRCGNCAAFDILRRHAVMHSQRHRQRTWYQIHMTLLMLVIWAIASF